MSSLKALAIDPEDSTAKQIMARVCRENERKNSNYWCIFQHLHAVIHSDDDQETLANMDSELRQFHIATFYQNPTSETSNLGRNLFLFIFRTQYFFYPPTWQYL